MSKTFSVVIGNPPYQLKDGGHSKSAKALYNKFVDLSTTLSKKHVLMITPSRWMQGGKGLNDFRNRMKGDGHIKLIKHFDDASRIFPETEIRGGVSYFLWDKNYRGNCNLNGIDTNLNEYDIILVDIESKSIVDKVLAKSKYFMSDKVYARKPFGLSAHYKDWCNKNDNNATKCYTKGRNVKWVNKDWTDKHNLKGNWKVLTARALSGNNINNFKCWLAEPGAVCVETYLVVSAFKAKKEAENFIKYTHSKFFRFMLNLRIISQDINRSKFSWVPDMQDYFKEWADQKLYGHFGLTQDEVSYIEEAVK